MTRLQIDQLTVRFGREQPVFAGLSFDIDPGAYVTIQGESGVGKSSLLRCIAGLLRPSAGRILFDGRDASGLAPHQRGIAMVFQTGALYPSMSIRRNVRVAVKQQSGRAAAAEADRALRTMGLSELARRRPETLSGGQRQRVALARAVASGAGLWLLDEPLSQLDVEARHDLRAALKELHGRLGPTVLHVTHDPAEAEGLGERLLDLGPSGLRERSRAG